MSVDGIKIGRYTSKKKAEDVLERRRIEQQQQEELEELGQEVELEEEQQEDEEEEGDEMEARVERDKDERVEHKMEVENVDEQEIQELIDVIVRAQHRQVPNITKHLQQLSDIQRAFVESGHEHSDLCSCGVDEPNQPRCSHPVLGSHVVLNDDVMSTESSPSSLSGSHSHCFRVASRVARIFEMAANDLSSVSCGEQSSPTSAVSSESERPVLLEAKFVQLLPRSWRTSTDEKISSERRNVLCRWLVTLEKGLRGIVEFVKQVPGFDQLTTNDKINLVRRSICESWLVTRHRAFNRELNCYTAYNGFTFDLVKAVGEQFSDVLFGAACRMQALKLTDEETFVVKAFVFFFTDGIELEDSAKVETIQRRLLTALKYMLHRSHSADPLIVARLITAITQLRNVTDSFRRLW